jgi:hypothetical protein
MGERVVVGRATPVEPIDEPGVGPGAGAEPLNYGRGDRAGDAWRWTRARVTPVLESIVQLVQVVVVALGGWRRIGFALGLACLLGGLGDCLAGYSRGEGAFWMFVGGLLIGLTVRVPLRGSES